MMSGGKKIGSYQLVGLVASRTKNPTKYSPPAVIDLKSVKTGWKMILKDYILLERNFSGNIFLEMYLFGKKFVLYGFIYTSDKKKKK